MWPLTASRLAEGWCTAGIGHQAWRQQWHPLSPLCRDGHWTAAPRLLARAFLGFSRCAQHVAPPMSHASGTRRFETCHPRAAYSCMAVHASGRHPSRTSDYCLARGPRAGCYGSPTNIGSGSVRGTTCGRLNILLELYFDENDLYDGLAHPGVVRLHINPRR